MIYFQLVNKEVFLKVDESVINIGEKRNENDKFMKQDSTVNPVADNKKDVVKDTLHIRCQFLVKI